MCQHKCGNYWAGGNVEKWASCVIVVYLLLLDLPEPPITTAKGFPHITPPRFGRAFFSILNCSASSRNSTGYLDRIKLIYYAAQNSIKWDDCHLSVCHESQTLWIWDWFPTLAFALLTVGAWQQFGQLVITISGTDPFPVLPTRGFPLFRSRTSRER